MTRAWVAWLFALPLSFPAVAAAQGIVNGEGRCAPVATGNDCARPGSTCAGVDDVCHAFSPTDGVCAPEDALFCATAMSGPCPTGTSPIAWNDIFVCVPPGAHLCADASSFACFTSMPTPSGPSFFPVAWRLGDCDGDGVPNGLETAEGLCVLRPLLGVTTGDDCNTPPGCVASDPDVCPADTVCTLVDRAAHRYCLPEDDFIFCCGGARGVDCPNGGPCQTAPSVSDDYGFCDPFDYCSDFFYSDRLSCLEADDAFPVEPDEGDCDDDGIRNVDDDEPCVPGVVVVPDGGAPRDAGTARDAGEAGTDGGEIRSDAGPASPMDGGRVELQPGFSGGGGCRCRAAPPEGGSGALWGVGLAALWIARRRLTS